MTVDPNIDPDPYMTRDEVAKYCRVSISTLERWFHAGDGPTYSRLGARRMLFRRSAVDAWVARKSFNSQAAELAANEKAATADA